MIGRIELHTIAEPGSFFRDLGALHDVEVVAIAYAPAEATIEIAVEDLYWGIEAGDGHVPRPATFVFDAVTSFSISGGEDRLHYSIVRDRAAVLSHVYAITHGGVTRVDLYFQSPERWFIECGSVAVGKGQA